MTSYIVNVGPYVDLGYVVGDYTGDGFLLQGIDAEFRTIDGIQTLSTAYTLTGRAAVTKSNRFLKSHVNTFAASLVPAVVKSNRFQKTAVVPFTLFGVPTPTAANRRVAPDSAEFLLRGFPVSFVDFVPPFRDAVGRTSDISDQSKDYEALRKAYGGSDNTSPSFLRQQYVRYDSVSHPKDLGQVEALDAELRGRIGTEVGTSSLFFKLECLESSKILFTKLPAGNRYDRQTISISLLDSDRKPIPLDQLGYASPYQSQSDDSSNTPQQEVQFMAPGVYYFTVSCSRWQAADYGVRIFIGGTALLSGTIPLELTTTSRVAQSYISGLATLQDSTFGNLAVTFVDDGVTYGRRGVLAGVADATTDSTLALSRTSPYSTT